MHSVPTNLNNVHNADYVDLYLVHWPVTNKPGPTLNPPAEVCCHECLSDLAVFCIRFNQDCQNEPVMTKFACFAGLHCRLDSLMQSHLCPACRRHGRAWSKSLTRGSHAALVSATSHLRKSQHGTQTLVSHQQSTR